jgi:SAM-dependent methyltransferase
MKLNLGSGTSRYQDYLSVDYYVDGVDVQHDLTKPLPYEDESVDAIYSSHVIEHFSRAEWEDIRKDWARVIKPGGTIEIRCPDIYRLCADYHKTADRKKLDLILTRIYGQQGNDGQFHKNGFDQESLGLSFPDFSYEILEPSTDYELHMRFTK